LQVFPAKFDVRAAYTQVQSLAQQVTRATQLQAAIEDPSGFQDGPLFTRIILHGDGLQPAGQILLSSFGRLATMDGVREPLAKKIGDVLRAPHVLILETILFGAGIYGAAAGGYELIGGD
jgi:hypothetical protein